MKNIFKIVISLFAVFFVTQALSATIPMPRHGLLSSTQKSDVKASYVTLTNASGYDYWVRAYYPVTGTRYNDYLSDGDSLIYTVTYPESRVCLTILNGYEQDLGCYTSANLTIYYPTPGEKSKGQALIKTELK